MTRLINKYSTEREIMKTPKMPQIKETQLNYHLKRGKNLKFSKNYTAAKVLGSSHLLLQWGQRENELVSHLKKKITVTPVKNVKHGGGGAGGEEIKGISG